MCSLSVPLEYTSILSRYTIQNISKYLYSALFTTA